MSYNRVNFRTRARTARGWDIGLAAAILAVVLLGWLTAPGSNGAPPGYSPRARPAAKTFQRPPGHGPVQPMTRPAVPHR
jgi:hypothetical protein